jgi:hypothetical protein
MQEQTLNQQSNETQTTASNGANGKIINRLIKGYIIFMAAMNAIATVMLFNTYRDLSTHSDPTLPHWPFLFTSLLGVGVLVGLYGLWNWKRWGFTTVLVANVVALLITLVVLKTIPSTMSFVGLGLFLAVFVPRFKQMS